MASAETIAEKHKESALQATRRLTEVEKEVMQYKREIEKAAKVRDIHRYYDKEWAHRLILYIYSSLLC